MRKVLSIIAPLALAACGVVDNPQTTPGPPNIPPRSETGLAVSLRDFNAHVGDPVDVRYVGGDGTVLGYYRYASLPSADFRIELLSVPRKPESYVDVLIDGDRDGAFEPESEPAWSRPITASGGVTILGSEAQTGTSDPAKAGGRFRMRFTGFGHLDGELLRVALLNPANQMTGLFTGAVSGDEFDVILPEGVVETQPYTIALFADANGNGEYDAPPTDAAWYAYATGDAEGINYVFAYNDDFEDSDFEQ